VGMPQDRRGRLHGAPLTIAETRRELSDALELLAKVETALQTDPSLIPARTAAIEDARLCAAKYIHAVKGLEQ
jgi:hypothetical protein